MFVESFTRDQQKTFMDDWKRSISEVFDQGPPNLSQSIFYPAMSNEADHFRENPYTMHEYSGQ